MVLLMALETKEINKEDYGFNQVLASLRELYSRIPSKLQQPHQTQQNQQQKITH
ncbi:MAG: hypothetical protein QXT25_00440 [Candidatus Anstonellaceae archaeon]